MTCRERLSLEHPDYVGSNYDGGCKGCPSDHLYADDPEYCSDGPCSSVCGKCWDREFTDNEKHDAWKKFVSECPFNVFRSDKGCECRYDDDNHRGHCVYVECPRRPWDIIEKKENEMITAVVPKPTNTQTEPSILDSGDRTQFESGAVRDMREGKGRFDICPLEVIGNYLCDDSNGTDPVIWAMTMFLNTKSTSYLYSAMHQFELMYYPDPYSMFLDVAIHFEQGAKKYGEANFKKGIPAWCYIDSATRHYIKCRRGDTDEVHTRGVVWNLMCCIWELDYGEEWRNEQSLKEMVNNLQFPPESKQRQITVTKKPYNCRLGDYTRGLFEFEGDVYAKINTATDCGICVNILTGIKREFHPDIVVTTVDIGEIFTKEAASND